MDPDWQSILGRRAKSRVVLLDRDLRILCAAPEAAEILSRVSEDAFREAVGATVRMWDGDSGLGEPATCPLSTLVLRISRLTGTAAAFAVLVEEGSRAVQTGA